MSPGTAWIPQRPAGLPPGPPKEPRSVGTASVLRARCFVYEGAFVPAASWLFSVTSRSLSRRPATAAVTAELPGLLGLYSRAGDQCLAQDGHPVIQMVAGTETVFAH